ncbi:hypothetical protein RMSM_03354 [Rhodopirellula maiorica SM1]|uniref:Uncharacterized protein n=1 Tax=Rhodopirellula maiorica SM1 TaxID=1265738 RepID=M5S0J5_9BACT|nr:hypothetical protein RMSM_03354 [Rhodopirellula maiorica SM1]
MFQQQTWELWRIPLLEHPPMVAKVDGIGPTQPRRLASVYGRS